MQYQINDFKVLANITTPLAELISKKYKIKCFEYEILSRSIDARRKNEIYYVYRLLVKTKEIIKNKNAIKYVEKGSQPVYNLWKDSLRPIIIGFGPAGIFASLYLARCNAKPIIIERGSKIEERIKKINDFFDNKTLDINSNIQFGEGGAGTFSDGKLTTNLNNSYIKFILREFVNHGASEDILYDNMPHIGTDVLRIVVKNIRLEIEKLGGEFYFDTTFLDAQVKDNYLIAKTSDKDFITRHLLLGIGHSAKDTIRHLYRNMQLDMQAKAFSMGVRVEHKADSIDYMQYGSFSSYLPRAYYKLSTRYYDRGVYTFCMCPGGYVMASTSDEKSIVTNGMSNYKRDAENSNSAILVDVRPEDYGNDVLLGLDYQEKYERLAFDIAGDYRAPANLMKEFLNDEIAGAIRKIKPSYPHGIILSDLRKCLPDFVIEGIKKGIIDFDNKMKGFYDADAILTGIESRSSSPVRILRDKNRKSNHLYIYPMGEGAGYAGGITSASLDGLLTAMKITEKEVEENE